MNAFPLSVFTYGKWILAGEHSVLRGVPALVFPLKSKYLHLQAEREVSGKKQIDFIGPTGPEYEVFFRSVAEKLCELLKLDSQEVFSRHVVIEATLPVGTGLGASAAFCVSMCQLFHRWGYIPHQDLFSTALKLENLFHGESSGVDIAVCLSGQGLLFERNVRRDLFEPVWSPFLYVSYTGERGITFDCVKKVKALIESNPQRGQELDDQMRSAVSLCMEGLREADNLVSVKEGMDLARNCFQEWGLITAAVQKEMDRLQNFGALAVKPTGSGGGGFVLSLWKERPVGIPGLSSCFTED